MDEQQVQYPIYFQGSKDELFVQLQPVSEGEVFEHMQEKWLKYSPDNKQFSKGYESKNFTNMDGGARPLEYVSTSVPTISNYFYSTLVENNGQPALVWKPVERVQQMRPKPPHLPTNSTQIDLTVIDSDDPSNSIQEQIQSTASQPLSSTWNISTQQYLAKLTK